jgi:hypothetical protein
MLTTVRRSVWLVVPAVLAVYLLTRAPAVGLIDSGELAAGCRLMNILHPTGYPLYTMLGRLATLVPVGSVFSRVTLLSSLLGAAGVGLFLLVLLRLKVQAVPAAVTSLVLGFSLPVWGSSVDVEVYALTLVLGMLVWFAVAEPGREKWLFGAYLAGLVFANHMSGASIVAGALACLLVRGRRGLGRRLPMLALLFLLGLTPYLFLVLRARAGPLLAWGNPVDLERFWWHVTGKQYRVWMFSLPFNEVMANAGRGLGILGRGLGWVLVPAALYGLARLWRENRALAAGLAVTALLCFGYAVNYSIPDIDAYYIPGLAALALSAGYGLDRAARRMKAWRHLLWLVPAGALVLNFGAASRRDHRVGLDNALNAFRSADSNAIVLTDWWDLYSPTLYLQQVEAMRPDLCFVDVELVRRSWYFEFLRRYRPRLVERSRPELDRYLGYLDRFEHGTLKDPAGIQRAYIALLRSFVLSNPDRPSYVTMAPDRGLDARQLTEGFRLVPMGVLYQLRTDSLVPEFDYSRLEVAVPARPDERTSANLSRYAGFASQRAALLLSIGREQEARQVADWHRSVFGE